MENSRCPAQCGAEWRVVTVVTIPPAISEVANLHRSKDGLKSSQRHRLRRCGNAREAVTPQTNSDRHLKFWCGVVRRPFGCFQRAEVGFRGMDLFRCGWQFV